LVKPAGILCGWLRAFFMGDEMDLPLGGIGQEKLAADFQ
jgi:hypothetical protein